MLSGASSKYAHLAQNAALICLSIFFLPLDTFLLVSSVILKSTFQASVITRRQEIRASPNFRPRRVLVTGVGMTKGLFLARKFYEAGHNVIGADFELDGALVCGRLSNALDIFYTLPIPNASVGTAGYIQKLQDIIVEQEVELWVSCSGVASAIEDGEAKEVIERTTPCKAIQFDIRTTQILHEKDSFIRYAHDLGFNIPETHTITSRQEIVDQLSRAGKHTRYILKPIGVDDARRADMTLLPRPSVAETQAYLSRCDFSSEKKWLLQQYLGGPEYCTHALVVQGRVKAFLACPSSELLMHYQALPHDSKLCAQMLKFTKAFAADGGQNFTGHLSFDFLADRTAYDNDNDKDEGQPVLYPIECNPRCHTAVALFNENAVSMTRAYLSVLDTDGAEPEQDSGLVIPTSPARYYWIGHDLVELLIIPLLSFCLLRLSLEGLLESLRQFSLHLCFWRDGTYEYWDPLPWWWLYHVYWPSRFWNAIRFRQHWSRINVSTAKMFSC